MPKGDKKKKKEVTAQIAQLELEIKQKHETELDAFFKVEKYMNYCCVPWLTYQPNCAVNIHISYCPAVCPFKV